MPSGGLHQLIDAHYEALYRYAYRLIESAKLQQALNELDEAFRTPIILFYFEEFSYRDIAEQMDLPIGTVMSRLARAKAYLRAKLAPQETNGYAAADGRKEVSDAVP